MTRREIHTLEIKAQLREVNKLLRPLLTRKAELEALLEARAG